MTSRRDDRPLQNNGVKQMLRRLGREAGVAKVHAHRFRHTFATWAIENQARELDVQYLLGHSTPDMVRRYSATYNSEKAARAHELFSPADRLRGGAGGVSPPAPAAASNAGGGSLPRGAATWPFPAPRLRRPSRVGTGTAPSRCRR